MTRADTHAPKSARTPPAPDFKTDLLGLVPFLRAFARSLTGNYEAADDLVQRDPGSRPGSRATRSSSAPTSRRGCSPSVLATSSIPTAAAPGVRRRGTRMRRSACRARAKDQNWRPDLSDTTRALKLLPDEQREALILVGAGGFSYRDAAAIVKCNVGTVKSSVARARKALLAILEKQDSLPSRRGDRRRSRP